MEDSKKPLNENEIEIEYMTNNNESVVGLSDTENEDEEPVIELNEEEEEDVEDDEVDELKSMGNRSKEIVLDEKSKKTLNSPNTILIEKLDDEGKQPEAGNEDELFFEANNEEGRKDLFEEEDVVTIQQNIALQESEQKFEDEFVYIQDLQNQLLAALPVSKQGLLYIQKRIEREVMSIMQLKKEGMKKNENIEKGIEYNYQNKWIIPISLDIHRVFITLKEEQDETFIKKENKMENMNEIEAEGFITSKEDSRGIQKEDQRVQMKEIKSLDHKSIVKDDEYTFGELVLDLDKITKPYLPKLTPPEESIHVDEINSRHLQSHMSDSLTTNSFEEEKKENENEMEGGAKGPLSSSIGFFHKVKETVESIRYYDIDNIYWNSHKNLSEIQTFENIRDEKTDQIKEISPYTLIPAEEINTVGFIVLPHAGQNITDLNILYTPSNYSPNLLSKSYKIIGNIEKVRISDDKSHIIVSIPNHGLSRDSHYIIIEDCDYSPTINGIHKSINVIDDNNISFKNKRKMDMIHEGSHGKLFSLSTIPFDKYKIIKESNRYNKEFLNSTYDGGEESSDHIKLYLFDEINIKNVQEYEKIMRSCAPTLREIFEMEKERLEKCSTMEDMDEIVRPYGLSIIDLYYSQFQEVEKILKAQFIKIEDETQKELNEPLPTFTFHSIDKNFMSNPSLFLADIYISSPFIEKYYGKYMHLKQPEDSLYLRFQWMNNQLDHGLLFIYYVLYENLDLFYENHPKEIIQSMLELSVSQFQELEITLKKEYDMKKSEAKGKDVKEEVCSLYHYEAYQVPVKGKISEYDENSMKVEDNGIIYYLPNGTLFFIEEKIYIVENGKKINFEGKMEGVMALVGDHVYVWDQSKKSWDKSDTEPKYHQIRYLCEFGEKDIREVDLDSMDCVYRENIGCDTRIIGRLKDKISKVEMEKVSFEELKEYIEKKIYKKKIEEGIQKTIFKYFSRDITSIENEMKVNRKEEKNEKNEKEEEEKKEEEKKNNAIIELNGEDEDEHNFQKLLSTINQLPNYDLKRYYIFQLLDKDGILIGKDIYSKKYRKKMLGICGHWIFENRIFKTTNMIRRDTLYNQMTSIFGDGGSAEANVITCNHCGNTLIQTDYDEVEGFASSGAYILSRSVIEKDQDEKRPDILHIFRCDTDDFKKILFEKGFTIDSYGQSMKICEFVLNSLCQKTGVNITSEELVDIIRDSMDKLKRIIPKQEYIQIRMKKLEEKGIQERELQMKQERGDFDRYYKEYFEIKYRSIIAGRFLITVQTSIPSYKRDSTDAIGGFVSFDGEQGIQYLATIFKQLGFIIFNGRELEESEEKTFERYIDQSYKDYLKSVKIQDLIKKKMDYEREIRKKKVIVFSGDEPIVLKRPIYPEVSPIPENFEELVSKASTASEIQKLDNQLLKRMYYVAQKIKDILKEFLKNDSIIEGTGMLEATCCKEALEGYTNYMEYIKIHIPEDGGMKVSEYMEEANNLTSLGKRCFLGFSSISRGLLKSQSPYPFILNPIIVCNPDRVSQSIIQDKFSLYVDEGKYVGEMREFVGEGMTAKDVKSGKTRKEIIEKTYSHEEFKELLNAIGRLHTKIPEKVNEEKLQAERMRMQQLLQNAEQNLHNQIIQLVTNILTVLNRKSDSALNLKLIQLIENMGIFHHLIPVDENKMKTDLRYKISMQQLRNAIRLRYIKKVFNEYFRRYLSMIQNNYKIESHITELEFTSEVISKQIQEEIFKEYDQFSRFLLQDIRPYFEGVKFDMNADEIQDIYGKDSIYNHKYDDIIDQSDFDNQQACMVLTMFLVEQLNKMIICIKDSMKTKETEGEEKDRIEEMSNVEYGSRKCQFICEFFLQIFQLVEKDHEMVNSCHSEMKKIDNIMIHEIIEDRAKMIRDEDMQKENQFLRIYNLNQLKTNTAKHVSDVEEKISEEQETADMEMANEDRKEMLKDRLMKEYQKQGKTFTQSELDEAIQRSETDFKEDDMIEAEENQIGELIDVDAEGTGMTEEILGDGNYGDYVGETDD